MTPEQAARLAAGDVTLRNRLGDPYCNITHGEHQGEATWTDAELDREIQDAKA